MTKRYSLIAMAALAATLLVLVPVEESGAHGPRGGVYVDFGGFTFGTSSYGPTFFGINGGPGFPLWGWFPDRRPFFPRYGGYRGHRHGRYDPYGPYGPRRHFVVDSGPHRHRSGTYNISRRHQYTSRWARRVWIPGRSTSWGYERGRWEMRPLIPAR